MKKEEYDELIKAENSKKLMAKMDAMRLCSQDRETVITAREMNIEKEQREARQKFYTKKILNQ